MAGLTAHWLKKPASTPNPQPPVSPITPEPNTPGAQDDMQAIKPEVTTDRPRTVEEMLNEADDGDSTATLEPPPLPSIPEDIAPFPGDDPGIAALPETGDLKLPDKLTRLLREARYAQIEGNIRRSIIKLEEAAEMAPDNPVVCYYFGLAYEFLRNAPKSREYFSKVIARRDKAGKYYELAILHLERGFSSPADRRGDISFGTILEYREPDTGGGERVVLTIPILMKDGLNIRPDDLYIPVHFFDSVNGKSIDLTRAEVPNPRWMTDPVDWKEGEEIVEVTYHMPPLSQEEITAYGDLKYYGYTAKLYYKGEPMDAEASPPVLFLIEQMKANKSSLPPGYSDYDDSLLPPPIDAVPVSDDPGSVPVYPLPDLDSGLLPP